MPRKKQSIAGELLPDHDIFGNPLAQQDRQVLLNEPYRRKEQSGYITLWNEFYSCYRQAGVSPQAVYLWGYLRQLERRRPEWKPVSDIAWPGRRDMSEVLGASMRHLPNLLEELRSARLVSYQPTLPGFEDLAQATNSDVEKLRKKAAGLGANPKADATIYRTADPLTRAEFAVATGLKYCQRCKFVAHCQGAREAREQALRNDNITLKTLAKPIKKQPSEAISDAVPSNIVTASAITPTPIDNTPLSAVALEAVKTQRPNLRKTGPRFQPESEADSNRTQGPILTRIKTNMKEPDLNNQPNTNTTMLETKLSTRIVSTKLVGGDFIANYAEQNGLTANTPANYSNHLDRETVGEGTDLPDFSQNIILLENFGFDPQTADRLASLVIQHRKPPEYVPDIIQYARENATTNPCGLVRRLIERGENRLTRERQQRQALAKWHYPPSGEDISTPLADYTQNAISLETTSNTSIQKVAVEAEIAPIQANNHLKVPLHIERIEPAQPVLALAQPEQRSARQHRNRARKPATPLQYQLQLEMLDNAEDGLVASTQKRTVPAQEGDHKGSPLPIEARVGLMSVQEGDHQESPLPGEEGIHFTIYLPFYQAVIESLNLSEAKAILIEWRSLLIYLTEQGINTRVFYPSLGWLGEQSGNVTVSQGQAGICKYSLIFRNRFDYHSARHYLDRFEQLIHLRYGEQLVVTYSILFS